MDWNFSLDDMLPSDSNNDGEYMPPSADEEAEKRLGWPYIKFLQGNSTLAGYSKGDGAGMVAIGKDVLDETVNKKRFEGHLFDSGFAFFPIDNLTEGAAGKRKGARAMWKYRASDGANDYNADDEQKAPLCKSSDGLAPFSGYLGRSMQLPTNHPKFGGGTVVIGLSSIITVEGIKTGNVQVQIPSPQMVCESCPMSQWYKDNDGKWRQLCSQKFTFVIYVPAQSAYKLNPTAKKKTELLQEAQWPGGFAILQGSSKSTQMSLTAKDGGRAKPVLSKDGKELTGFFSYISRMSEYRQVLMLKEDVPASLKKPRADKTSPIKGFSPSEDRAAAVETTNPAELMAMAQSVDFPYALVEVPAYKYATTGLPQHVGLDAAVPGMRYMSMGIVESAVQNNPNVPDIGVLDEPVLREHVELWLEALKEYSLLDARKQLLGTEGNLPAVTEKLALAAAQGWQMLTAGREDAPMLPSSSETVAEGEIEDLSDM